MRKNGFEQTSVGRTAEDINCFLLTSFLLTRVPYHRHSLTPRSVHELFSILNAVSLYHVISTPRVTLARECMAIAVSHYYFVNTLNLLAFPLSPNWKLGIYIGMLLF